MNNKIPQPGTCAGCADLQRQVESLDRGLIEAAGIAHDALTAVQALRRHQATQDEAWEIYRAGKAAAQGDVPVPRPRRRGAARKDRAALTVVRP